MRYRVYLIVLIQSWKLLEIHMETLFRHLEVRQVKEEHISDSDRILGFCEEFVEFE